MRLILHLALKHLPPSPNSCPLHLCISYLFFSFFIFFACDIVLIHITKVISLIIFLSLHRLCYSFCFCSATLPFSLRLATLPFPLIYLSIYIYNMYTHNPWDFLFLFLPLFLKRLGIANPGNFSLRFIFSFLIFA